MKILKLGGPVVIALCLVTFAYAHHSAAGVDQTKTVTLEGVVKEFKWANPHSYLEIEVKNAKGVAEIWNLEMMPPTYLVRAGWKSNTVKAGDTIYYSSGYMVLDQVTLNPNDEKYQFKPTDTALMAHIQIRSVDGTKYIAKPVYYVRNNQSNFILDTVFSQGLAVGLSRVVDAQHVEISVKESSRLAPFVALKVLQFPFINLLWIGTILMILGFAMSMGRRLTQLSK